GRSDGNTGCRRYRARAPAVARHGPAGPYRGPHRRCLRRLVRRHLRAEPVGRRQHACQCECHRGDGSGIPGASENAFCPPFDRGDESRRNGRRRQARQAVGGAGHSGRGGLAGPQPARRRSSRSACRTRPAGERQPRAVRPLHAVPAKPREPGRHHGSRQHRGRDSKGAVRASTAMTAAPLLEISGLAVEFHGDRNRVTHAVSTVDLTLAHGASLGIVGESGCGKSVTALTIMRLLTSNADVTGSIVFDGRDLLALPDGEMRDLRGDRLTMIFQEPMTSLNPSLTVGEQIAETLIRHRNLSPQAARAKTIELIARVNIPSPELRYDEYPHKLSGGMRQRVMIALALACDPQLL